MLRNRRGFARLPLIALTAGVLGACTAVPPDLVGRLVPGMAIRPMAQQAGTLEIRVAAPEASAGGRTTQATVAEVDRVKFDLEVSEGDDRSQTVPKAEFAGGGVAATATFAALWPGEATVSVTAFDTQGSAIGTARATTAVAAGSTTVVDLVLTLVPTYVDAAGVRVNVGMQDGQVITVPTGQVTTIAGDGANGYSDGPGVTARLSNLNGVAVDASGNVFIADAYNHRVRKVSPQGLVSTYAGSGTAGGLDGPAPTARFNVPVGVLLDTVGNLYVTEWTGQRIRKINPAGVVSTLAGSGAIGAQDGVGTAASFYNPVQAAFDPSGNLILADKFNHRIRRVTLLGVVTTVAGSTAGFADGPVATARFNGPQGVAVEPDGTILVTDDWNHRIRRVSTSGEVSTLAGGTAGYVDGALAVARFNRPDGMVRDASGNLFLSDWGNSRIRRVSASGIVSTLAGSGVSGFLDGAASSAQFRGPTGIALDSSGALYIGDQDNYRLRRIF